MNFICPVLALILFTAGSINSLDYKISIEEFQNSLKAFNSYLNPAEINKKYTDLVSINEAYGLLKTKRELAMFLTQIMLESDGLIATEEYACKQTKCPGLYVSDKDYLYPGRSYYGRGYIQLSWSANYKQASEYLFGDDRLLKDPDMVARDDLTAWMVSFWFWKTRVQNDPGVQRGEFGVSTKIINGFIECGNGWNERAKKRFELYQKILIALNVYEKAIEKGCYN